ncbi:putative Type-b response regulator [Hibiscus syriacus]|uniref:Type-b response regulator n=1 Tax=Hibiscus syriacus TaxID=106335 RepID=A0A6A3B3R1_HIBSY|nr:putative Type-b response regulator [Hibiscus syriacus]
MAATGKQVDGNYPSVRVTKTVTVTVHPKSLHPQQIIHLSNLDRQCPMLMYVVFFYKASFAYRNLSLDSVFNSLKSGLEETLSIWYPAAVLVEAVTSAKIVELGDLLNTMNSSSYQFGCGGYSIGIGTSHSLFDGPATYDFLRAWASNSAILKEKRSTQLYKPVHERVHCCGNLPNTGNSNLVLRTFHLSGAMIESLKSKVFGERRGSFSCSSFELVAAHLWKEQGGGNCLLAICCGHKEQDGAAIAKGFSGNAFVLASVALTVEELENGSHEATMEKIKAAKNSISDKYVIEYNQALDGGAQEVSLRSMN